MPRMLFEKKGNAIWMSHLDLMRLFQRAFKRAGLSLRHTQGFSPRPLVSIALPLSVGIESHCELLDFELEGVTPAYEQIMQKLNDTLVAGVQIKMVYDSTHQIKDISYLSCEVILEYDSGVPKDAEVAIMQLFASDTLIVKKRTKNGMTTQNIVPMIHKLDVKKVNFNTLVMSACISCQNPALNPMQLTTAIQTYLPQYQSDFVKIRREEIYDSNMSVFR